MKNLLFFMMMFFIVINITAQNSTEVEKLQNDIKTLRSSNYKLKTQLNELLTSQTQILTEIKDIYSSTDKQIKTNVSSLNLTNSSVNNLETTISDRFLRYKTFIKIAVITSGIGLILVFVVLFLIYHNLKKKMYSENKAMELELSKQHDIFMAQLNITNDAFDKNITSITSKLNVEMIQLKKNIDQSIKDLRELDEIYFEKIKEDYEGKIKIVTSSFDSVIAELKQTILTNKSESELSLENNINQIQEQISLHTHDIEKKK